MAGLLLAGYYFGPVFLRRNDGTGGAPVAPGSIEEIALAIPGGEAFLLKKTSAGWEIDGRRGARADASQIDTLLSGAAGARLAPADGEHEVDWESAPVLRLVPRSGDIVELQLGPRLRPFREQLIRTGGEVYTISFDLSACLGIWEGDFDLDVNRVLDKTPILLEDEEIVRIHLKNTFADYVLERTDEIVERRKGDNGETEYYGWTAGGPHSERQPAAAAMHRYAQELTMLAVERLPPEPVAEEEAVRQVVFTTSGGRTFEVAVGKRRSRDERLLWLRQPYESDAYVVGGRFFHRFTPAGATLFRDRPRFETGAADAGMIAYERNGHRLVLDRDGSGNWRIARPQIPYAVYTPPPDPGAPQQTMAEIYASGIDTIVPEEIFVPDTPERRRLVRGAFDEPAARLIVRSRSGTSTEVLLSPPVGDTGSVFVSVNGEISVLGERAIRSLAPDIEYFLNPIEIEGRSIEW